MKIVADTNLLVRAVVEDDTRRTRLARAELEAAETVALTARALCELVWVVRQGYGAPRPLIAETLRKLLSAENVAADRRMVEAGLAELEAGGDFADGVIAHEGRWLGGEAFVSFDRAAVRRMQARGEPARLLE